MSQAVTGGPATEAQPQAVVPLQRFRVKRVLSGDSFIVQGVPQGGPPPEKQVNLAWLIAPKMVRGKPEGLTPEQNAEPWAWEAKEFLRKLITGKDVTFRLEYKIPMGQQQREFGVLFLDGVNVSETIVSEGWAEVRQGKGEQAADHATLLELEAEAKAAQKGRWSGSPAKREFFSEVDDLNKVIGKTFKAIVDHVRDGSSFRVYLDMSGDGLQYTVVSLNLSGVRCPGSDQPFGDQAKYFSEVRILGRDVDVRLEQTVGAGTSSSFYGTLWAGEGKNNLAEHLVQNGMAKCMDRTLLITKNSEALRAAERDAKSKRLRVWRDYVAPVALKGSDDVYDARVIEVVGADSVMVQNISTNETRKVFLSSIRPPRANLPPGDKPSGDKPTDNAAAQPRDKTFRPLFDIPYMLDAREFLRSKLVGKKVNVQVDYVQEKSEKYPEKVGATITLSEGSNSGMNLGEALVSRGLATVIRARDDQRALNYDVLLAAEDKALKAGKGVHSKKPWSPPRILDLSNDSNRAKGHLAFLTRPANTRRDAIVEFVYSASRIKLWIQKDNCMLNLVLAGVSSPKLTDAHGLEAMALVKGLIHQRTVQVLVEGIDKVGNFIGWLYIPADKGPERNLATELVKHGFGSVRERDSSPTLIATLKALEAEAKNKKIGIWQNWVEPVVETAGNGYVPSDDEDGDSSPKESNSDAAKNGGDPAKVNGSTESSTKTKENVLLDSLDKRLKVVVTEVAKDMTSFYAQSVDDGRRLEEVIPRMRAEIEANPPLPGSFRPEKGHLIAARFSLDNQWYRAKLEKIFKDDYTVLYVDYGNRETLTRASLAPLPGNEFSSLAPAARPYTLAFVTFSQEDPEMVQEAYRLFSQDVSDVELFLKVEYKDANGHDAVTLINTATKMDIGHQLVLDGLALAEETRRDRRVREKVAEYSKAQSTAMSKRLNLWQYGDFRQDDAREFGVRPSAS